MLVARCGSALVVLGLFAGLSACGKVEEPPPVRSVSSVSPPALPASPDAATAGPSSESNAADQAPSGANGAAATDAGGRCLEPTPEQAPAPAHAAESCPADDGQGKPLPKGSVRFVDAPHKPLLSVELAREPEARARGLMYRTRMPDNQGMLFSWSEEQIQTFWMHNTCIPLDMLFIAKDGLIVGILEQIPTLNDRPRSVACPVLHVLEVNAGWSRKHGVRAGQRVEISASSAR
jgi:hypothetical protein